MLLPAAVYSYMHTYIHIRLIDTYIHKLMHVHSKNEMTTESILHITTKLVFVLTKISIMTQIFIS